MASNFRSTGKDPLNLMLWTAWFSFELKTVVSMTKQKKGGFFLSMLLDLINRMIRSADFFLRNVWGIPQWPKFTYKWGALFWLAVQSSLSWLWSTAKKRWALGRTKVENKHDTHQTVPRPQTNPWSSEIILHIWQRWSLGLCLVLTNILCHLCRIWPRAGKLSTISYNV